MRKNIIISDPGDEQEPIIKDTATYISPVSTMNGLPAKQEVQVIERGEIYTSVMFGEVGPLSVRSSYIR